MAKRKAWEELKPDYRERLQRHGITKESHEAGASLAKARGKISEERERARRLFLKEKRKYIAKMVRDYGLDKEELEAELADYDEAQAMELFRLQKLSERLYFNGETGKATKIYTKARDMGIPKWMIPYHSLFQGA